MADTIFAPGGHAYVTLPRVPLGGLKSRAGADVLVALLAWSRRRPVIRVTDRDLAEVLEALEKPASIRQVQRGLKYLEKKELIVRQRLREWRDGAVVIVRQITLLFRVAEGAATLRKSKKANAQPPKNFGPPHDKSVSIQQTDPAFSLKGIREEGKENRAGAADAGGGTPSSSPASAEGDAWGGAPSTPKEAADFLRAKIAEFAESKAIKPPPPRGPRRERPREVEREERPEEPPGDPVSRAEWDARRKALADASVDQLAALDALGNRDARAELNRRHHAEVEAAKLAAATQTDVNLASGPDRTVEYVLDADGPVVVRDLEPPPEAGAPPRGRDSPEVIPPPSPEKSRSGILGRLFGRC